MANMVVDHYTNVLKKDPVTYATKRTVHYSVTLELPDLGPVKIRVGTRASNVSKAQKQGGSNYSKYAAISWGVVFSNEDDPIALAAKEGLLNVYKKVKEETSRPSIESLSMLNCALNAIWKHPTAMTSDQKEKSYHWTIVPLPEELKHVDPKLKNPVLNKSNPNRRPVNPAPAPPFPDGPPARWMPKRQFREEYPR